MLTHASLRTVTAAAIGAVVISGLAMTPAHASGPPPLGELLMHGTGLVFAGNNDIVTTVTSPGGTGVFAIKVKNTGSVPASYAVKFSNELLGGTFTPTVRHGLMNVTTAAYGPNGYVTPVLQPTQTVALSLRIGVPKTTSTIDFLYGLVTLEPVGGDPLAVNQWTVNTPATTGQEAMDQYTSTPTSRTVRADDLTSRSVAQTVQAGGRATYTVKLQNDSTAPAQLQAYLFTYPVGSRGYNQCTVSDNIVIKHGASDITGAMRVIDINNPPFPPGYFTPVLAPGQSVTLTITVMPPAQAPPGCLEPDAISVQIPGTGDVSDTNLITNVTG